MLANQKDLLVDFFVEVTILCSVIKKVSVLYVLSLALEVAEFIVRPAISKFYHHLLKSRRHKLSCSFTELNVNLRPFFWSSL